MLNDYDIIYLLERKYIVLTAVDARRLANDFERRKQAKEKIESLSPWIEEQALKGKNYLLFSIKHLELEDLIVQELKDLGYEVFKQKFQIYDCSAYIIYW